MFSTCYNLLAPPKRRSTDCATILSLLSTEGFNSGEQHLYALSKHSIILLFSLPLGLPQSIRGKLWQLYHCKLYDSLANILPLKQRLSNRSGQSATVSKNSTDNEEAVAEGKMKSTVKHLYV